ncbi:ABC transporter substrate-binding protein [Phaeobacter sp. PT47_59]|uniref:ABC transporter substrate-binding protein n=1 Tax=Phaeobacter sp. PT47_59 TaxID=3029979 RepID=UPI00238089D7|nr:ABC transporter substrate-binding protein [Phaeobacter sp. PT47_59]MDE4175318.1 ABC transporter substrate-binding protein [Phaeobacter sp. PT47_59]
MPPAPPARVVSMNLCTDQLSMLLAGADQLVSVSFLARDPRSSAMSEEAESYIINHGRAEEIYLLQPDLVIASAHSRQATVSMLRRLDIPVAVVEPARSLEEVSERIAEVGALLGRERAAQAMITQYERDLTLLRATGTRSVRGVLYAAQGWTAGDATLAGQILRAAGLQNVADELGYDYGGALPLEQLVMVAPDMIVPSTPYAGHSRAEEILLHPVIDAYRHGGASAAMRDADWVCGTPHVLRAVARLSDDRKRFETGDK